MMFTFTDTHTARTHIADVANLLMEKATKNIGLNHRFNDYYLHKGNIMFDDNNGHYMTEQIKRKATQLDLLVFSLHDNLKEISTKFPDMYVVFQVKIHGKIGGEISSSLTEEAVRTFIHAIGELFPLVGNKHNIDDLYLACDVRRPEQALSNEGFKSIPKCTTTWS